MDAVTILRQLWRQRLVVAVGVLFAALLATLMAYKVTPAIPPKFESRQYQVGIASSEVLVDSPSSQVADIGGGQVRTDVTALTARARLLANLMATSPLKDQIARRAGIDPRVLIATAPVIGPQLRPTIENGVVVEDRRATTLTVYFNETLPIITADAQAMTPEIAARISAAAVDELGIYLKSIAADDKISDARQLVISPLGSARSATVQRGPRRLMSAVGFVFILGAWCLGIIVFSRLAHSWREVAAEEDPRERPTDAPTRRPEPVAPRAERAARAHGANRSEVPVAGTALSKAPPPRREPVQPELGDLPERPQRRGVVAR